MALESDSKFEENLTCGLENNMRNLANFRQSTWKLGLKIGSFIGYFYPKQKMYELKIHIYVLWQGRKMRNLKRNWLVQNWHEEFNKFWPKHLKISKICTLMGCFWPKYIMLQLRKYREVMFDGTQDWLKKFEGKLICCFKNDKNLVNFDPSTQKSPKFAL